MKNELLAVGNVVSYEGKAVEVTGVSHNFVEVKYGVESHTVDYDEIQGVELNREWLKRLGDGSSFEGCQTIKQLEYVHQLQNIVHATIGEKLEVTL